MGCCQHFPDCLRACVCHVGGPDCSGEAAGREGAAGGAGGGVAAARVAHAGPGGGTCNLLPGSRCRTQQPGCPQAAGGPSAAGHLRSRRAGFRGPAGQDAAPLCRHGLGLQHTAFATSRLAGTTTGADEISRSFAVGVGSGDAVGARHALALGLDVAYRVSPAAAPAGPVAASLTHTAAALRHARRAGCQPDGACCWRPGLCGARRMPGTWYGRCTRQWRMPRSSTRPPARGRWPPQVRACALLCWLP